jgi:hypothetical protein
VPREGFFNPQYSVRLFLVTPHGYAALWPQTNLYPPPGELPFTMAVAGDLRGQKIVAQTYFYEWADGIPVDSSELSDPLVVNP